MRTRQRRTTTYQDVKLRKQRISRARLNDEPCSICGQPINYKTTNYNAFDAPTVDHVLPWRDHPTLRRDPGNLAIAHRACNTAKGVKVSALPAHGNTSRNWGQPAV